MTSLLLHVGLHKTATTSFQCFLAKRDRLLADFGCLYPLTARAPGSQHALLPGCYFPNHPFLPKDRSLSVDYYINALAEELAMAPYSLCVMSSEVFTELLSFDAIAARMIIDRLSDKFERLVLLLTLRDIPALAYSDLKNRLRDISLGLRRDFAFSAPMFFNRIEMHKQREREMWRSLGVEIVEKYMDDGDPVMSYFGVVLDMMPVIERAGLQSTVAQSDSPPEGRNSDPYAEVEYLLMMITGLKLAAARKSKQATLTLESAASFFHSQQSSADLAQVPIGSSQVIALLRCLHANTSDTDYRSSMQRVGLSPVVAEHIDLFADRLANQLVG
jgi:hypothetical protein